MFRIDADTVLAETHSEVQPAPSRIMQEIGNLAQLVRGMVTAAIIRAKYGNLPEGLSPEIIKRIDAEFCAYTQHRKNPHKYRFEYFPEFLEEKYPSLIGKYRIKRYLIQRYNPYAA